METSGVSCVPKFEILVFWDTPVPPIESDYFGGGIWQSFALKITNHLANLMSALEVSKLGARHGGPNYRFHLV